MEKVKPSLVFVFIDCVGGIPSFYWNLINNSNYIKQFKSKVVLLKAKEDLRPRFLDVFHVDEVIYFDYSIKDNQYFVQKRLNRLIDDEKGALVTDNGLPIQALARFNNQKTVFHIVHDYFYVNQNIRYSHLIDIAIAHSSFFCDAVYASNPNLYSKRSFYIPYGVKSQLTTKANNNSILNLVFLGRLDQGKGVFKLFEINEILKQQNVKVKWTIIGKGPLRNELRSQWSNCDNVAFYEPDSTQEVYDLLKPQDIFVFPTTFEGTPVSILESLANGIVVITNDLPGGIRDIVKEGIGFRCNLNEIEEFTDHITRLDTDRKLLHQMQKRCLELAKQSYDINKNADLYFAKFLNYEDFKRPTHTKIPGLSLLDKAFIPNRLVHFIRSLR